MNDIRAGYELIRSEFLPSVCTFHLLEDRQMILGVPSRANGILYVTSEDVESRTPLELISWLSERIREHR